MRVLAVFCGTVLAACGIRSSPSSAGPVPPGCHFGGPDSSWLSTALDAWQRKGAPALRVAALPVPPLILFDSECVFRVTVGEVWQVQSSPHGGRIQLPDGRTIPPMSIGITSPGANDTTFFLALALPQVWQEDIRYRPLNESRSGWEEYLMGAFSHEMAHARMLPNLLGRLRALEAGIYPDTIEDNAVQNRFADSADFAAAVSRETQLLYRAASAGTRRTRLLLARAALESMEQRRARYYTGDDALWSELEQTFLDLEGVAQWAAFQVRWGPFAPNQSHQRQLAQFRSSREFWSEDQGLSLVLALDALVPDWQQLVMGPRPPTTFDLLRRAILQGPSS